jgi:hypothetical protein
MHMSFRDIGAITNRLKSKVEREKGYITYIPEQEIDTEPKSKQSQAFILFSEGKTPVEVVIALDLPADQVQAIYREYWELKGMHKLAQIYDEVKCDLHSLLSLYKVVKDLGMEEHEIINVLQLASSHHLEHLQWKAEYLRNDIDRLEVQKTKCSNHILKLYRRIDEFQAALNNSKFSQSNSGWDSIDISYASMIDYGTDNYCLQQLTLSKSKLLSYLL